MTSRPPLGKPLEISPYRFRRLVMVPLWPEKIRRMLATLAEVPSLVEAMKQASARKNLLEVPPCLYEVAADAPVKLLEPTDPLSLNPAEEDAWLSRLRFLVQNWDAR
jgi:hypothetical protein